MPQTFPSINIAGVDNTIMVYFHHANLNAIEIKNPYLNFCVKSFFISTINYFCNKLYYLLYMKQYCIF